MSKADDFLKILFEVRERKKRFKKVIEAGIESISEIAPAIPIPKRLFRMFFEDGEIENVFRYLESFFINLSKRYRPVLIIDELQKIRDVKIDGLLIYELFNFFVRLTKELHVCHVFVVTSDSLFLEKVHSEAMLQGRCRYLLIDDFDRPTTESFLRRYNFRDDEIELVWQYFGGKPVYLVEAIKAKQTGNLKDLIDNFLRIRISQIKDVLYKLEDEDRELFNKVVELFGMFKDREEIEYEKLTKEIVFCIRNNILFAEPVRRILKPQSRLDLLAMRIIWEKLYR